MQFRTSASAKASPGLTFMQSAFDAMPRTLGDRVRIAALGDAMHLAIKCRMRFAKEDIEPLNELRQHTCVGVFRPFDEEFYRGACIAGGTYPALWEKVSGVKSWIAPEVLVKNTAERLKDNRVCPGLGVLIGTAEDDCGHPLLVMTKFDLAAMDGKQLWWCTSIDNDHIILCRYARHATGSLLSTSGMKPARRLKLTREQWAELFQSSAAPAEIQEAVA